MKNGDIVKDTISGFRGIVVAEYHYLNGCVRLAVQPQALKDGKPIEAQTFDIEQLALVKSGNVPKRPGGGPRDAPARAAIPSR